MPASYEVLRNGQIVLTGSLNKADTMFIDTTLAPNTTYTYIAKLLSGSAIIDTSQAITLTTMDTTSHNFTWEVMSFGNGGGSELNDVAIIDADNIWAVGEIHTDSTDCWNEDSTEWLPPYNAVHWDGQEWKLKRIFYEYNGDLVFGNIKWIFAINENDIWFGNSVHWNGQQFHNVNIAISVFQGIGSKKMWGNVNGELYVVGNQGTMAYSYNNGSTWQKLTSGTDLPIQDIWGATDPHTGKEVVLCVASRRDLNFGSKLLKIEGESVTELSSDGLSWSLRGIWFVPGKIYYIAGSGLYPSKTLGPTWQYDETLPMYYTHTIRGINLNDIATAGGSGFLSHFNGLTWKHYMGNELPDIYGNYYGVDIKDNIIVAVGTDGNSEILSIGRRN